MLWEALCLRPSCTLVMRHCLQALHGGGRHVLAKDALGYAVNLLRGSSDVDLEAIGCCEMLGTSIDEALKPPSPGVDEE